MDRLTLANEQHKTGITWVDFDTNGKVIGYAMWTAWDEPNGAANAMQKKMTSAIRAMRKVARDNAFYMDDGGVPQRVLLLPSRIANISDARGQRLRGIERVFQLSPLYADAFAAAAKAEGAISREGQEEIRTMGAQIKRTQEEIDSSPIHHHRITPRTLGGRWFD